MRRSETAATRAKVSHGYLPGVPGIAPGMQGHFSRLTPLAASKVMGLTCPICGTRFHRPPCHVARVNVCYCSVGCANEGHKCGVMVPCAVCGEPMYTTPSKLGKVTTCSKTCARLKKIKPRRGKPYRPLETKAIVAQVRQRERCERCGVTHGPWIVRGIVVAGYPPDVVIDASEVALWCQHCHLSEEGPRGGQANAARLRQLGLDDELR